MTYTREQLQQLNFKSLGDNVKVHESVLFFGADKISIGNNVRIDCYSVISAGPKGIGIGSNVHFSGGVQILGTGDNITIEDFAGLAARVLILGASDDYTDGFLTGPTIPMEYRKCKVGPVLLKKHAIVGAGSVIMPGIILGTGAAVGALSYVNKNVPDFAIVSGNPIRKVGNRNKQLLELEKRYLDENQRSNS